MNLKHVNKLIREKKIPKALEILEELKKKNPGFFLYQQKIYECEITRNKYDSNKQQPTKKYDSGRQKNQIHSPVIAQVKGSDNSGGSIKNIRIPAISLKSIQNNPILILKLAVLDLINSRYEECVNKCKKVINLDKNSLDAYRIAVQASIELENFDEATLFFLNQPAKPNPSEPIRKNRNPIFPADFSLPPLVGAGNNYSHISQKVQKFEHSGSPFKKSVSIIIPVYNQQKLLANTLAALTHQSYPKELTEIIVVDDGSSDEIIPVIKKYKQILNLTYARQCDQGFRLSKVRNMGLKMAQNDYIIIFDADILPLPGTVEEYMKFYHASDDAVLLGHRSYVDVSTITDDLILEDISLIKDLPRINPKNNVSDCRNEKGESIDWRLPGYLKTDYLKSDTFPFKKFSGGNISFPKQVIKEAGYFDEEFESWGCEDLEFGYRVYNSGYYFIPVLDVMSLHQEPSYELKSEEPKKNSSYRKIGHGITEKIYSKKCPAPGVRIYEPGNIFEVPKVSIYIPAYNASLYIKEAVDSCLYQEFDDLEVCICDDGSTDDTLMVLEQNYSSNPRVRWMTKKNGGISSASNAAIAMCRGMYIGQLDADDFLKPQAVATCVKELDTFDVDAVYTDCELVNSKGEYIRENWCSGEFSREWLLTGMTVTHFRMFRKRIWSRTSGFDETMENAVDFDFWLKISEKGKIRHIHKNLYSYRWHAQNTSIRKRKIQEKNHLKAANNSLIRLGIDRYWKFESAGNKLSPRDLCIKQNFESGKNRPFCNICGNVYFLPGPNGRLSQGNPPKCATCGSLERHRILRIFWERLRPLIDGFKVLQFAKDIGINPNWVKTIEYSAYGGENSLDIMNINRLDESYNCVIANHVLEHVPDDITAIKECLRIAGEGGIVQITIPSPHTRLHTIDWGKPDPDKHGHYRDYGSDFANYVINALPLIHLLQIDGNDPVCKSHELIYVLSRDKKQIDQVALYIDTDPMLSIVTPE